MSTSKKDKLSELKYLVPSAVFLFFFTVAIYGFHFPYGLSDKNEDWGTFGDFMGGTLNPIFAIFSLAAILYTIKIQTEELNLTTEELKKSSKAQQEQSESFKIQNESIKLQSFENTFFQLMNLFLKTREHLKITIAIDSSIARTGLTDDFIINNQMKVHARGYYERGARVSILQAGEYSSYEAIKMYLILLEKVYEMNYDDFNDTYEGYTGTYCIQIYQILKFIDNSQIEKKQFYVNLLRAQFTKEELEFLFYHCLGSVGERKFKPLVEQFEFFEHLVLNDEIETRLTWYLENAFGKNESILLKHKELKEKMEDMGSDF